MPVVVVVGSNQFKPTMQMVKNETTATVVDPQLVTTTVADSVFSDPVRLSFGFFPVAATGLSNTTDDLSRNLTAPSK